MTEFLQFASHSNAGGDASVVMFVDGVCSGRGGAAPLELYDLERVEVLEVLASAPSAPRSESWDVSPGAIR